MGTVGLEAESKLHSIACYVWLLPLGHAFVLDHEDYH
jgi:hypothetical protein